MNNNEIDATVDKVIEISITINKQLRKLVDDLLEDLNGSDWNKKAQAIIVMRVFHEFLDDEEHGMNACVAEYFKSYTEFTKSFLERHENLH